MADLTDSISSSPAATVDETPDQQRITPQSFTTPANSAPADQSNTTTTAESHPQSLTSSATVGKLFMSENNSMRTPAMPRYVCLSLVLVIVI